jgi:hypothetical protein
VLVEIIQEREADGERERKEVKREALREFPLLLALAVEAGVALSSVEEVRSESKVELEQVSADALMAVRAWPVRGSETLILVLF